MRVGILGCGNIASIISDYDLEVEVVALYDRNLQKAKDLSKKFNATACESFEEFIKKDFDTVLEIASFDAVRSYAPKILENKNMIILSSGALMDKEFRSYILNIAKKNSKYIRVPSGALFGVDNAKVLSFSKYKKVFIKSSKNPEEFGFLDEKKLVFKGKASECIKLYPKQTNVTVTISLATGVDADVEIWSDPDIEDNIHELFLEGDFGKTYIKIDNIPSPKNPKTSFLAALSIVALFKEMNKNFIIGT